MHPDVMLADGEYYRWRYYREVAHRRQVAQTRSTPRTGTAVRTHHRLGRILVLFGMRLHGTTPPIPEATLLDGQAATGRSNQ